MQESFTSEHSSELFTHTLEQLLDGRGVANECGRHFQASWWDIAHSGLDIVRDPFDEVRRVLVLNVQHLFVDFFHGHATTEDGGNGQVASVTWITSGHHVLGVEHLLGQLGYSQCAVLLRATRCQWSKAWHKEVKTWKWNHVDGQFSQVSIQLTWKSQASGHTRHCGRDQMVQVTICWRGQFQCSEANVIQSFIVNAIGLVGVLDQLMDR
jgi:hypothetical protein